MKSKLEKNILLIYITRALHLPFFWLPILFYYLTQVKGFSVIQTTFLLGLQEFALIFLELPTGVVADKISRKFSVMLGYLITSLPFIFLPVAHSLAAVTVIFLVKAVGKALVSGADSALLYDTLIDLNRASEYKKIKTQSVVWMMAVATITMFAGGWMGEHGYFEMTFILPFALQLLAAFAAYLMVEPETSVKAKEIQDSNYLIHTANAIKIVFKNRWLLILTIIFALLEGTAVNMKWYYPAIFANFGYGLLATGALMGILYGGKTVINAIGSKLIHKDAYINTLLWSLVITFCFGLLSIISNPILMVGTIILMLLGLEIADNSTEELIHESLESKVRATAMSFVNLLSSVGATALLWGWGGMLQFKNLGASLTMQAMIFGVASIVFYIATKKQNCKT